MSSRSTLRRITSELFGANAVEPPVNAGLLLGLSLFAVSSLCAAQPLPPGRPTKAGPERVLDVLSQIEASLTASRYTPVTRVDVRVGSYEFDCSGMAAWVLHRAAPAALHAVRRRSASGRVVARDFVRTIASVHPEKPAWAWTRVPRIEDAQAGDIIAWLKPAGWKSNVTGHVGFVVASPQQSRRVEGGYLVRFADASRYQHQDDSRAGTDRDGFGVGTILIVADFETGAPRAYGWFGEYSGWIAETQIVIGRPRR